MAIKVYILLALVYFVIGIVSVSNLTIKNQALKAFIVITVLLPITKFTTAFHIQSQIAIYYFFFFGVGLVSLKKMATREKINKNFLIGISFVLLILVFFSIHYYVFVKETRGVINVLKDIKPFVMLILAYLFIDYYKDRLGEILTKGFINKLLVLNMLISTFLFLLMYKFRIHVLLTEDPYFKYEGLRYETLGTYFGVFYMVFLIVSNKNISFKELFLLIVPILYTGNRTLILSVLLILVIYYITKASAQKVAIFFSAFLVFAVSLLVLVNKAAEESPLARFKEILSIENITNNLLTRFSPFIQAIESFNVLDFFIGKGFGYTFFIPWFTWRSNINNYNIYLDNLYLTLYAKYGIFFLTIFFAIYLFLRVYSDKKVFVFYFLFVLIVSLTNAMVYQYNFLWLLLLFVFPFSVAKR